MVNLGNRSHFHGLPSEKYYGADYNRAETIAHHRDDKQEYCIAKTILAADALISVPKMKTHKKVGVTLNIKGLVGANTNKNCLIHYRLGSPAEGGDQYPATRPGKDRALVKVQRWAYDRLLAKQSKTADAIYNAARGVYRATVKRFLRISPGTLVLDAGNWHGNDSAWRMAADLATIIFFADAEGRLHDRPQRKIFCLVDGIVGGDRLGPLEPEARRCGCLVAGEHAFAVDMVTTRLMGFDPRKIRQFEAGLDPKRGFGIKATSDIDVRFGGKSFPGELFFRPDDRDPYFGFKPHPGWAGQVEV
jgi:hypothetical protein